MSKLITTLKYWGQLAECECDSNLPQGGCFACDMVEAVHGVEKLEQQRDRLAEAGTELVTLIDSFFSYRHVATDKMVDALAAVKGEAQ